MYKIFYSIKKVFIFFVDIFFPNYCFSCNSVLELDEYKICEKCINLLKEPEFFCKKCGRPTDLEQDWCSDCKDKKIYYEKMFIGYYYSDTIKQLLKIVKYKPSEKIFVNFDIFYNLILSNSKIKKIESILEMIDFILPVPIHKEREKKRGYNQTVLFAEILRVCYSKEYRNDILLKKKNTNFFFSLNKISRELEIKNAFEIINKDYIKDKNILILDDISTTGTTINNISKILLDNGANSIFALCFAHGE